MLEFAWVDALEGLAGWTSCCGNAWEHGFDELLSMVVGHQGDFFHSLEPSHGRRSLYDVAKSKLRGVKDHVVVMATLSQETTPAIQQLTAA